MQNVRWVAYVLQLRGRTDNKVVLALQNYQNLLSVDWHSMNVDDVGVDTNNLRQLDFSMHEHTTVITALLWIHVPFEA